MYIVNQDGNQAIELHSVRYSCYWSERYEEIEKSIINKLCHTEVFDPICCGKSDTTDYIKQQIEAWKEEHPYEEVVDIYVDGDQKFGMFYSRQQGIEEYENILKALKDGVVLYQIPEINEGDRNYDR